MSTILWEKAPFKVDVELLRADVSKITAAPVMVNKGYGGWSVTSFDGTYTDGWLHPSHTLVDPNMTHQEYRNYTTASGLPHPVMEYSKPTEICSPYMQFLIDEWRAAGLYPCRVRLALMKPGHFVRWHQDAPDAIYSARLHVAIQTNSDCFFESQSEQLHMPADGSTWFVQVNRQHRARNSGPSDRIHLMANIYDTEGVSATMKFVREMATDRGRK